MTHPTREEWMSYLYDESSADTRAVLQSHLDTCAECRAQFNMWKGAARELSAWRLPSRRVSVRRSVLVRWAAAAAIVAFAVAGSARIAALNSELKQLRAEVQRGSQRDFDAALAQASEQARRSASAEAQALVAGVAQGLEERRLADQQATFAALQKLNARHTEDFASMRKELETVAVFTEAGFQRTQNQLVNMTYSPMNSSNNNP